MTLLKWHVTILSCFVGLVFCGIIESADENNDVGNEAISKAGEEKLDSCPTKNSKFPVYLQHPADCTKFYICDSGRPHLKQCLPGLHFNPKIKTCDYPKNALCDAGGGNKPKERVTDEISGMCPKENSKFPVYLPHPDYCNKFYTCDSGKPHLKTCHPGLHFNTRIKACDYPENANCEKDITDTGKGRIKNGDFGICPAKNSEFPVYFPHSDDCSKFYICDNGKPYVKKCQLGLHFNQNSNACDYPEKAGCGSGVTDEQKGRIGDNDFDVCPTENSEFPVYLSHPNDCSMFYVCDNGKPYLKKCQAGLHFNQKLKACDYPENAGCNTGMTLAFAGVLSPFCPSRDGKIPIFFRHPTNCSKYYMCGNGFAYAFACPARLHFNLRQKVCDYEDNANCRIVKPKV